MIRNVVWVFCKACKRRLLFSLLFQVEGFVLVICDVVSIFRLAMLFRSEGLGSVLRLRMRESWCYSDRPRSIVSVVLLQLGSLACELPEKSGSQSGACPKNPKGTLKLVFPGSMASLG